MFFGTQPDDTLVLPDAVPPMPMSHCAVLPYYKPKYPVELDYNKIGAYSHLLKSFMINPSEELSRNRRASAVNNSNTLGLSNAAWWACRSQQGYEANVTDGGDGFRAYGVFKAVDVNASSSFWYQGHYNSASDNSGWFVQFSSGEISVTTYNDGTAGTFVTSGANISNGDEILIGITVTTTNNVIYFSVRDAASGTLIASGQSGTHAKRQSSPADEYYRTGRSDVALCGWAMIWDFSGYSSVNILSAQQRTQMFYNPFHYLKKKTPELVTYTPDVRYPLGDARAEMPSLWIPKPDRPPTGPVVIDYENPLTDGLVFFALPAHPTFSGNMADKRRTLGERRYAFYSGSATQARGGAYINASAGTDNVNWPRAEGTDTTRTMLLCVARGDAAKLATMWTGEDIYTNQYYSVGLWTNGSILYQVRGEAGSLSSAAAVADKGAVGQASCVVATSRSTTDHEWWVDGIQASTSSTTAGGPITGAEDAIYLGGLFDSSPTYGDGWYWCAAIWNRGMSSQELDALSRNPYQFLLPA